MPDLKLKDGLGATVNLIGSSQINIILGRNGSGKSRFLRLLDSCLAIDGDYRVSYVTPERTGSFQRDGNIETNMASPGWSVNVRRANQVNGFSFKAMSHLALRNAENFYLRRLQNTDARGRSFQIDCLNPISRMLGNVSIEQGKVCRKCEIVRVSRVVDTMFLRKSSKMNIQDVSDQIGDHRRTRTSLWKSVVVAGNLRKDGCCFRIKLKPLIRDEIAAQDQDHMGMLAISRERLLHAPEWPSHAPPRESVI